MEKFTLNDIGTKIILPIILGAIGFIVTDLFKQNDYKIQRQKYAADVLKNVYGTENANQGLSYLEFAEPAIENSSSILSIFFEKDSLKEMVQKAIYANYIQLRKEANSMKDSGKVAQIDLAISNNIETIQKNSLDSKTNSEWLTKTVLTKKQKAIELEKQMYQSLSQNDYNETIKKSEELDDFFPQFHMAYEVGKTLRNAQKASNKSPERKDSIMQSAKERVKKEFNYGYTIK